MLKEFQNTEFCMFNIEDFNFNYLERRKSWIKNIKINYLKDPVIKKTP